MKQIHRGLPLALALGSMSAWAHEGHGLPGSHWHATDVWGFVVGALVVAGLAAWWRNRG